MTSHLVTTGHVVKEERYDHPRHVNGVPREVTSRGLKGGDFDIPHQEIRNISRHAA
jgi:hypothetical protein